MSVFLFVIFVIQRLLAAYRPSIKRAEKITKGYAWKVVVSIILIAFILNSWTVFVFHLKEDDMTGKQHCGVNKKFKTEYFVLNSVFGFVVIVLPLLTILIANCLMKKFKINNLDSNENQRSSNTIQTKTKRVSQKNFEWSLADQSVQRRSTILLKLKPHYYTKDQLSNMNNRSSSNKSNISLLLILFSFVILTFPHLMIWSSFFYNLEFLNAHPSTLCHFPIGLQLAETFSLLYYVAKLIILVFIGSLLRRFVKPKRNINFFEFIIIIIFFINF